jgi:hypothetical protein
LDRLDEDEIDDKCDALRQKLEDERSKRGGGGAPRKAGFKPHEVHEMADAKMKESERLRSALKISKDYEEGSHWKRQEDRLRSSLETEGHTREDSRRH